MKSYFITLLIALTAGYIGGQLSQPADNTQQKLNTHALETHSAPKISSPFQIEETANYTPVTPEELQTKIILLENRINELAAQQADTLSLAQHANNRKTTTSTRRSRLIQPDKKNLAAAGIAPDIADNILRRMGQQKYRRLELQGLMRNTDPASRRQYARELRELNQNKISLRDELGDNAYDQYLFNSGQNNRVKVSSVMAGSPAESAGILSGDTVLLYNNKKIFTWADIRKATQQSETGSYINIEVLRNNAQMSIMLPAGPLGVELEPAQLNPNE